MASVDIADMGDEIAALVAEYIDDVERHAEEDSRAAAVAALGAVKSGSPSLTGKYAGGWAMEPDAEDMGAKAYRVFNKRKPGLTHLLEKGHGGPAPAGAHPHIAPAAQVGMSELRRRIHG